MSKPFTLAELPTLRSEASAAILANTFHALQVPEPHTSLVKPEDISDGYFLLPQLEIFLARYTTKNRSTILWTYIGNAAHGFQSARGDDFRASLISHMEQSTDTLLDEPLWVDRDGSPMSLDQIVPEPQLLDEAYKTFRTHRSSVVLESFIEHSIQKLGDRTPRLPGLI